LVFANILKDTKETFPPGLEKKLRLLFQFYLKINGEYEEIWTWTAPFIYATPQGESEAWKTVFWANLQQRETKKWSPEVSSTSTKKIPWCKMSQALSEFFNQRARTDWEFTRENSNYLGQKLMKTRDFEGNSQISRRMLDDKDAVTGIPFWTWFYSTVKLTSKFLREFWTDG
jgi:hypothetical protein